MSSLAAQVARFFRFQPVEAPASLAAVLMERAGHSAGSDLRRAQGLRAAPSAWLSVVR